MRCREKFDFKTPARCLIDAAYGLFKAGVDGLRQRLARGQFIGKFRGTRRPRQNRRTCDHGSRCYECPARKSFGPLGYLIHVHLLHHPCLIAFCTFIDCLFFFITPACCPLKRRSKRGEFQTSNRHQRVECPKAASISRRTLTARSVSSISASDHFKRAPALTSFLSLTEWARPKGK